MPDYTPGTMCQLIPWSVNFASGRAVHGRARGVAAAQVTAAGNVAPTSSSSPTAGPRSVSTAPATTTYQAPSEPGPTSSPPPPSRWMIEQRCFFWRCRAARLSVLESGW